MEIDGASYDLPDQERNVMTNDLGAVSREQDGPALDPMMERVGLDDSLCFALYHAANAIIRVYQPLLAKFDLTYPQFLVMMALWDHGPLSVSEIAGRLALAANAITPLIDRLETIGYVERAAHQSDRRISVIRLTDRGSELEQEASRIQQAVGCRIPLDNQKFRLLLEDLKLIADDLSDKGVLIPGHAKPAAS